MRPDPDAFDEFVEAYVSDSHSRHFYLRRMATSDTGTIPLRIAGTGCPARSAIESRTWLGAR